MSLPERYIRFLVLLGLIGMFLSTTAVHAQYFGRNKIQYEDFDFKKFHTDNFTVYFYPEEERNVRDAARMLERWYYRYSKLFDYDLPTLNPIILYADNGDFRQTNVISSMIGAGTGGFTEGMKQRVVMPLSGSYSDVDHVIGHELVHVFQYDIRRRRPINRVSSGQNTPLWFMEGMPEYLTIGRYDPETTMRLRDALIHDKLPDIKELSTNPDYFAYRWGHALWAYIGGKWGDDAIPRIYKRSIAVGWKSAIMQTLHVSVENLSSEWKRAIRETYSPLLKNRTNPRDTGRRIDIDSPINLAPSISPDGKTMALLSQRDIFTIDLFLADISSGEIIRKLSTQYHDRHFSSLRFIDSAGTWSPDGSQFAFVVYSEGDNAIVIFDTKNGNVVEKISFDEVEAIVNPSWSPDGDNIVFTGAEGGINDLYMYNLSTQSLTRLTDDRYSEFHACWSPDGNSIAFTTDRGRKTDMNRYFFGPMQIAVMDISTRNIRLLDLFEGARSSDPHYSPDGESLFFISDFNGFTDIYRCELGSGRIFQVTTIATGVTGITAHSPALSVSPVDGRLVFSVFDDFGYAIQEIPPRDTEGTEIYGRDRGTAEAGLLPPTDKYGKTEVDAYLDDPDTGLPEDRDYEASDYQASLQLDYIGMSSQGITGDRYGSYLGGGIGMVFSDMLGNHTLGLDFLMQNNLEDFGGQTYYINRDHRTNWGFSASRIPYSGSSVQSGTTTVDVDGEEVEMLKVEQLKEKVYVNKVKLTGIYPFSLIRRLEYSLGYTNYRYERTSNQFLVYNNRVVSETTKDVDEPEPLDLYHTSIGFTGDDSYFGFTSPMRGTRYNVEVEPTFGSIRYSAVIADFRRYFFTRYFTVAARLLHYGRYGKDAENDRMSPLFIGSPTFIRGYEVDTFNLSKSQSLNDGQYPELDRLAGSRIGVVNFEIRLPLTGTEEYGIFANRYLPVSLIAFADGGVAWTKESSPELTFASDTKKRVPVFSVGLSSRINLLGLFVFELYYAYPYQHPEEDGHFGFQIAPGW